MKRISLDRRLRENFSWPLLGAASALCLCGLLNLYSVSASANYAGELSWFARQSLYLIPALIGFGAAVFIDYQYLRKLAWPLYVFSLICLAAVLFVGFRVNGATRWLDIGLFRFQPSEAVKAAVVTVLAAWFAKRDISAGLGFRDLIVPGLLIAAPFILIHKQPDLGTALHLAAACLPMFLVFRFRLRLIATLAASAVILAGFMGFLQFTDSWPWLLEKGLIRPHQVERVRVYLNPEKHRDAGGWQVSQSENAVGSGQIIGRGFMEGPQHKNGFLPESETDFAFAALAEEWGLVGSLTVLALFACLISQGLSAARRGKDVFGSLIALGMTSILFWQVVMNVGMVIGLAPVVGIPLPFISYGGTSLVMTFISVGLILNVGMRRYLFQSEPVRENPAVWRRPAEAEEEEAAWAGSIRRLNVDTPFNPEIHHRLRLPHSRPWLKYLRKSRLRGQGDGIFSADRME